MPSRGEAYWPADLPRGLYPMFISVESGKFASTEVTLGARADSLYVLKCLSGEESNGGDAGRARRLSVRSCLLLCARDGLPAASVLLRLCSEALVRFCYVGRHWESRVHSALVGPVLGRSLGAAGRGSAFLRVARPVRGCNGWRRAVAAASVAAVQKKR